MLEQLNIIHTTHTRIQDLTALVEGVEGNEFSAVELQSMLTEFLRTHPDVTIGENTDLYRRASKAAKVRLPGARR